MRLLDWFKRKPNPPVSVGEKITMLGRDADGSLCAGPGHGGPTWLKASQCFVGHGQETGKLYLADGGRYISADGNINADRGRRDCMPVGSVVLRSHYPWVRRPDADEMTVLLEMGYRDERVPVKEEKG